MIHHLTGFERFLGIAPIGDLTNFSMEGVRNGPILPPKPSSRSRSSAVDVIFHMADKWSGEMREVLGSVYPIRSRCSISLIKSSINERSKKSCREVLQVEGLNGELRTGSEFAVGQLRGPSDKPYKHGLVYSLFLVNMLFACTNCILRGCFGTTLQISIETLLRCSLSTTLYSPAFVTYERNNLIPDDGPTYNVGRRCPLHELQRNRG